MWRDRKGEKSLRGGRSRVRGSFYDWELGREKRRERKREHERKEKIKARKVVGIH